MDAAKHKACENAAQLLTDYGGVAANAVIELRDVTQEAFASIMERYGPSVLDHDVPWSEHGRIATTHCKHVDLGSGVLVNVSWIEMHDPRLVPLQEEDRKWREAGSKLVIRSNKKAGDEGERLYWSNVDGWVDYGSATRFEPDEALTLRLPIGNCEWTRDVGGPDAE